MPKLNPDIETFARIKVVGIGGSGGNALNHMIYSKVKGVEFIYPNVFFCLLENCAGLGYQYLGK